MKKFRNLFLIITGTLFILNACNLEINKTIRIEDGSVENSSLNSVNGGIIIGKNCEINGDARAVNGQIEVGENSKVRDLQSVNGSISIARNVTVDGDIYAVNGSVSCEHGVTVMQDVNTINGGIDLFQTYVHRDVSTRNGNIMVRDTSRIGGDIIIAQSDGQSKKHRHIDITVADDSIVEGGVIVKDENVKVRVYLSNGGAINGKIVNAEVIEE